MLTLAALSPFLAFLLVAGFVGFVALATKRYQEKLDIAWRKAAERMDLAYSTKRAKGTTQRKLVGEFRGLPAKVNSFTEGSGKSKRTYTRYRLRYAHLGLGLELSQQHFFSGLKSALTGRQDIEIGDKAFDDAVIVQAGDSEEVRRFLTRERQLAIQRFLTGKRRALIGDDEASYITNGVAADPAKIRGALDDLHGLALALEREPVPASSRDRRLPEGREPEPAIDLPDGAGTPEPAPSPLDAPFGRVADPEVPGAAGLATAMAAGAAGGAVSAGKDGPQPPSQEDPLDQLVVDPRVRAGEAPRHERPADLDPAPAGEPVATRGTGPADPTDLGPPSGADLATELDPAAAPAPIETGVFDPGGLIAPSTGSAALDSGTPGAGGTRTPHADLAGSALPDSGSPGAGGAHTPHADLAGSAPPDSGSPGAGGPRTPLADLAGSDATPEATGDATTASLDYHAVRADLFETDRMSYETKDHFEAAYAGREVRWRGKLKRLTSYSSDLVFDGSGVKAMVELEPFHDGSFAKDVEALVQLPAGSDTDLAAHVGADVLLTGRLVACDGFMRKLSIADGLLEQA